MRTRMRWGSTLLAWVCALAVPSLPALAKPPGPAAVCAAYPRSPLCAGTQPACTLCHTAAPVRNSFGASLEARLAPGARRPLSDGDFSMLLPAALREVEPLDADGDAVSNAAELQAGTNPGDPRDFPRDVPCLGGANPAYAVCQYDARYVFKKLQVDFCGASPTYQQVQDFAALDLPARMDAIDAALDACLASEFWVGKNGQLWRLAHPKVRPVGSLKSGEDQGQIPLADYYDDYALFAYTQTGDRDAREVLTARYFVDRQVVAGRTRYSPVAQKSSQPLEEPRRAGNISSAWSLVYFVMFTPLPRNAASQMYRAYLGYDIAKQEGLQSVAGEPQDYDARGVKEQACAACHATLDPLSYPFRNYNGIDGAQSARYLPGRIESRFSGVAPTITQIPESGVILGQRVASLTEWARVAADSEAFARSVVTDYWKLLLGHPPRADEQAEFTTAWRRFRDTHRWRVQPMLHDLVRTEAYGAP